MNKEKILINENQIRQNDLLAQAHETVKLINGELIPALYEIGMVLTLDIIQDSLTGTNEIRKMFFANVEKDTKNIKTIAIKKKLVEAAEKSFETFNNELDSLKKDLKQVDYLTVEDGLCILSEENEEKLIDSARIYLTEPKEIEIYKIHREAAEILNRLFKGKFPLFWYNIFVENNGVISVNDSTLYSKIVNNGN